MAKGVKRGRTTLAAGEALLARITPTADYNDLAGCDLVIEAVFEALALKQEVFAEAMKVVEPDALLCSNTSTLPITELAAGVDRPGDFIGLHFFSPVDKMPLVEIIRGERTGDAALARAFDVASGIRKTPIVVNDSRGFFTSRVIGTFLNEGVAMLAEGIDPQTIEQASAQAGYPAPVLQLMDELTLTLPRKIRQETRAAVEAAGGTWVPHPADAVIDRMVDEFDRTGRSARRRLLLLRGRQAGRAVAGAAHRARRDRATTSSWPSCPSGCWSSRRWRRCAASTRACSPRCRTPTSARSSASASRPGPAAWCSTSRATPAAWPASSAAPTSWPPGTARGSQVPASLRARAARRRLTRWRAAAAPGHGCGGRFANGTMAGHTGHVAGWIFWIVDRLGSWGVGLLILLENLIPPIPSEVVLPLAGFRSSTGALNVFAVWPAATAGRGASGRCCSTGSGAWLGYDRLYQLAGQPWFILASQRDIDRGHELFERHGGKVVLIARCVPFLRSVVSIPAGVLGMPVLRFTVLTAIGSGVWNAVFLALGLVAGRAVGPGGGLARAGELRRDRAAGRRTDHPDRAQAAGAIDRPVGSRESTVRTSGTARGGRQYADRPVKLLPGSGWVTLSRWLTRERSRWTMPSEQDWADDRAQFTNGGAAEAGPTVLVGDGRPAGRGVRPAGREPDERDHGARGAAAGGRRGPGRGTRGRPGERHAARRRPVPHPGADRRCSPPGLDEVQYRLGEGPCVESTRTPGWG